MRVGGENESDYRQSSTVRILVAIVLRLVLVEYSGAGNCEPAENSVRELKPAEPSRFLKLGHFVAVVLRCPALQGA